MAKKSKLLAALDAHKGRDFKLEKQKKLQKHAEKRKKSKPQIESAGSEDEEAEGVAVNGTSERLEIESDGWEIDESEEAAPMAMNISKLDDSDSESESDAIDEPSATTQTTNGAHPTSDPASALVDKEEEDEEEENEEDIPLSDIESLASSEKADLLPHQRLTINNTTALLRSLASLTSTSASTPFSSHQTLLSPAPTHIPDPDDDLTRELAFYSQCLHSATEARSLLQAEGVPFSRPVDYFAEMVKSDEHMGKIKAKMHDEASNRKASAEARKQRDLKKFGKQVQVARLQERSREKKEMLGRVESLKRKRKNNDAGTTNEEELFDIALEDASKEERGKGRAPANKRQKRNEKFGFGGKKRFAKSGDAVSTGDLKGFSAKKMKGKPQRLGKSRRAKV